MRQKKKSLIILTHGTNPVIKLTTTKIKCGYIPKGKIVKVFKKRLPPIRILYEPR